MSQKKFFTIFVLVTLLLFNNNVFANDLESQTLQPKEKSIDSDVVSAQHLSSIPMNSKERYIYVKALENNISYDEAKKINDNEESVIPLASDEYISYRTIYTTANTKLHTVQGYLTINIASELRCIVSRLTSKVVYVESFGSPYAYTNDFFQRFDHGGFTIQRLSDTRARVSATGRFLMDVSVGVGYDILSGSVNGCLASKTFTIYAYLQP